MELAQHMELFFEELSGITTCFSRNLKQIGISPNMFTHFRQATVSFDKLDLRRSLAEELAFILQSQMDVAQGMLPVFAP